MPIAPFIWPKIQEEIAFVQKVKKIIPRKREWQGKEGTEENRIEDHIFPNGVGEISPKNVSFFLGC
jgi:hypothetical protein